MDSVKISVTLPKSWAELTDAQLYYVYGLLSDNLSAAQVKTYCFFRWTGLKVLNRYGNGWEISRGETRGYIEPGVIATAISVLDWMDELPSVPVRISKIKGFAAVDATLLGFSFEKYLYCDNLYQGYLEKQDHNLLAEMAKLLYDTESLILNQAEKMSIFYWWAAVKSLFSRTFCHFLTPLSPDTLMEGGASLSHKLQSAMNAQIRALTGGDITKHRQVLGMDVWTAMWELDAKAEEYNEIKRKYGN